MTAPSEDRKVILVSNTAWSIYNFRRGLIGHLVASGYRVTAVAPPDEYGERITALGCRYVPLRMDNKGANPLADLALLVRLARIFRQERASCVLTFTVKPNVYGTLAAHWLGIPAICNVTGIGTVFIKRTWVTKVVQALSRTAFSRASKVFIQNEDDLALFLSMKLLTGARYELVPGSGVDTTLYAPRAANRAPRVFRFLMMGRLLWDKGVGELVDAIVEVRKHNPRIETVLMGFVGVANRTAVSLELIREWERNGLVKYEAPVVDVRSQIANADCVVLPSYREGTPKALLEASSMGRPVIATDVPGCRQAVDDGVTGYLVRPRDAGDLGEKMKRMLELTEEERAAMGARGRQKMIREFDETLVIARYAEAIRDVLNHTMRRSEYGLQK
jgi:glycosyltransferase involved in cell wall biosynthesis